LFNQFALFETHFVGFYAIKRLIYSVQCLRISVVSSYIIRIKVTGRVALSWFVSDVCVPAAKNGTSRGVPNC
jgi:hypothetical protein